MSLPKNIFVSCMIQSSLYHLLVHRLFQSFTYVRDQLQSLWKPTFVDVLFSDVLTVNSGTVSAKGDHSHMSKIFTISMILELVCILSDVATKQNFLASGKNSYLPKKNYFTLKPHLFSLESWNHQ